MSFSFPATCTMLSGAACEIRRRSASALTSLAAIFDFGDIFDAHDTEGVLSQWRSSVRCLVTATPSQTNHWSNTPAISRSELVMVPLGFLSDTTLSVMSCGHCSLHTMLWNDPARHIKTPPAPSAEASVYATHDGVCGTNSNTCVGRVAIDRSSVAQSRNDLFITPAVPVYTHFGLVASIRLKGAQRPLPAGSPMAACLRRPTIFSNLWKGMLRLLVMSRSSANMLVSFDGGSSRHLAAPSKSHPRISLRTSHSPSPSSSFLIEMGSSPIWPLTDGGGKTPCMACSNARDRCRRRLASVHCISEQKSSTYTSSSCKNFVAMSPSATLGQREGGTMWCSNGWGGSDEHGVAASCSAMSLAVSVAAQKNGGDSHQPICRAVGMTI